MCRGEMWSVVIESQQRQHARALDVSRARPARPGMPSKKLGLRM